MTGLLVSVRSAAEAQDALAGGADLIDVKEPRRGSLGAADPAVWNEVCRSVAGRVPTSAALGELPSVGDRAALSQLVHYKFAKIGLAGCQATTDWPPRWAAALGRLPREVRPVAVAYADWRSAEAPAPRDVLEEAARIDCPFLLLDTFDKSAGPLLAHLSLAALEELACQAGRRGIGLVLAGSLDAAAIEKLLPLAPAYIAVRGAACDGDRTQAICAARVKRLAELVRTSVRTSISKLA
jgi:uncharacterized protein (UPF0264 family)